MFSQEAHDGAAWAHPLTDGLGSVRGYVDTNGEVLSTVHYSEYGVPDAPIVGPAFTGEWRDATGAQYHRARYLAPALGSWLSLDPFEGLVDRPMSLNGYAWVEGNPVMNTDPSGLIPPPCNIGAGACAVAILVPGPADDVAICGGTAICIAVTLGISITAALALLAEEIGLSDVMEKAIREALERDHHPLEYPDPDPSPTPYPIPFPAPEPDRDREECPTNHPPGSTEPFDRSREMEDVICNIRRHTALSGPQPASWWLSLQGRVHPVFGNAWGGSAAAYIGRHPRQPRPFREVGTTRAVTPFLGDMFFPRPGYQRRTRADIMALVVHELRHAGQHHSLFQAESVRGQRLSCANISGRIAEDDAWLQTNRWMLHSIDAGFFSVGNFREQVNRDVLNDGQPWTESALWDNTNITQYATFYGNSFDVPSAFDCPQSTMSISCVDPLVLHHL